MIKIEKASGELEEYSETKIRESASRIGVPKALQDEMLGEIRSRLYEGIKTSEIFAIIKTYLGQAGSPHLASKYNLKSALAELGPSGYPFEKFAAELLTAKGFTCQTNQVMSGKCVSHEVDVTAVKNGITYLVEAKFHKSTNQRTDVRVALYIHARFLDLSSRLPDGMQKPWIITNTRFSTDALTYATCVGIEVTSWGHPKGEGIMDLIEQTKLHPITILDGLDTEDKRRLLAAGIVTCRQFIESHLPRTLIPEERYVSVHDLARRICDH